MPEILEIIKYIPNRLPRQPNTAVSSITRKSQASANSNPSPTAYPVTAAIVGLSHSGLRKSLD